jgi:hypothetical protein
MLLYRSVYHNCEAGTAFAAVRKGVPLLVTSPLRRAALFRAASRRARAGPVHAPLQAVAQARGSKS